MENFVVWFDIPVTDIERAKKFYSDVFGVSLQDMPCPDGEGKVALFPFAPGVASGDLVQMEQAKPSMDGSTVYLNGGEDLAEPLAKVEPAGGKILQDKFSIGEHGFIAFFQDTEGNKVGIHSKN